ncbi:MAG: hypothetical protein FJW26_06750 [Acidimicrobiia bacterium]|nr:hypothetical protein [Acidimicrobiia bacterium]
MIRLLTLIFILCVVVSETVLATPAKALASIEEQTSWRILAGSIAEVYGGKALASYRPRDSAVISEYGFARLIKARLDGNEHRDLTVAIYEMLDSAAAYGLFTYLRPSGAEPLPGLGKGGAGTSRDIAFHQSKYYVSVGAEKSGAPRSALIEIGRLISKSLPTDFSLPMVAGKLPAENRLPHTERFVMGPEALSHLLSLGEKDPFGLATGAEAATARYELPGGERATLLLIHYPTQQLARRMLEAGYRAYSSHYPDQTAFYKRDGPLVVLALLSNSPELATALLENVTYVSMVSWDPKVEPPSIGQVMIRIFIFCGIMLGITLLAGLVFGVVRIVIKRYFPGKVFDRPETMEVIRLHLDKKR